MTPKQANKLIYAIEQGEETAQIDLLFEEAYIAAAESGADREVGYDAEEWQDDWVRQYLRRYRETGAQLAFRVADTFKRETESFEVNHIGATLVYLLMAILDPEQNPNMRLRLNDNEYKNFVRVMKKSFPAYDPVWVYVSGAKASPRKVGSESPAPGRRSRAAGGAAIVKRYAEDTGLEGESLVTVMGDLMADILHLAMQIDPDTDVTRLLHNVIDTAIDHFDDEQHHDPDPPLEQPITCVTGVFDHTIKVS